MYIFFNLKLNTFAGLCSLNRFGFKRDDFLKAQLYDFIYFEILTIQIGGKTHWEAFHAFFELPNFIFKKYSAKSFDLKRNRFILKQK